MKLLYNLFIQLYFYIAKVVAIYNPKAKKWVAGRKDIFEKLEQAFHNNTAKIIWLHCASLGEFEQGRTIIEQLKIKHYELGIKQEQIKILITFFSPSGYEIQKNYKGADWVFYLPIDTKKNAEQFYKIVNPSLIIFVKYEFWFHYITQAKNLNIPLLLVSGVFRNNQPFFKWYGNLHRKMLQCFTHFFLQNQQSIDLLHQLNITNNITLSGDTRFDRVVKIAKESFSNVAIEHFIGTAKTIVAGSTWIEDDEELDHFANTNNHIKFIIAPHEISENRLQECLSLYKNAVLFSNIKLAPKNCNVLIIDNVGMLSKLYQYATITYVGGGFGGDGVHNVLEAAVYGKPVVFGPIYDKFIEATELENALGACVVEDALELEKIFNELLYNAIVYSTYCNNAKHYVLSKTGATNKIIESIYANRLLTN